MNEVGHPGHGEGDDAVLRDEDQALAIRLARAGPKLVTPRPRRAATSPDALPAAPSAAIASR